MGQRFFTFLMGIAPSAAAGGVFVLLLGRNNPWRNIVILVILISFSFGISLAFLLGFIAAARRPGRGKLLGGYFFLWIERCAAALLGLGMVAVSLSFRLQFQSFSSGQKPEEITSCIVVLKKDGQYFTGKRWAADGVILTTISESLITDASGTIRVYGRDCSIKLQQGRLLKLYGRFSDFKTNNSSPYTAVFVSTAAAPIGWHSRYAEIRGRLLEVLEESIKQFNPQAADYYSALLLGRRYDPGSVLMRGFRNAGCMHLLALSGFHLAFIAGIAMKLLKPVAGFRKARILSLLITGLYVLIAGVRPSLIRAWLMYLFWTAAVLKHRKAGSMNILSLAFICQSVLWPCDLWDVGFQLSYAALGGILGAGLPLTMLIRRRFRGSLIPVAGLAAQGTTLPIVMAAFGVWRPIGIAASAFITPVLLLSMLVGSALMLISGLGIDVPQWLWGLGNLLVGFVGKMVDFFSRFPEYKPSAAASWLIAACTAIIPGVVIRRLRYEHKDSFEPRFPGLNPLVSRVQRPGSPQTMGSKLPDKPGCPGEDYQPVEPG